MDSKRKPLDSQSKEILYNLYKYFIKVNKDKPCGNTPDQLVATSTGIPLSLVRKVILENTPNSESSESGNK
jgi:hypothetical protein